MLVLRFFDFCWNVVIKGFLFVVAFWFVCDAIFAVASGGAAVFTDKPDGGYGVADYVGIIESTDDFDEFNAYYSAAMLDWMFGPLTVYDFDEVQSAYENRKDIMFAKNDIEKATKVLEAEDKK